MNIPIFITHAGCRNDCVFCNQKIITGQSIGSDVSDMREIIESYLSYMRDGASVNAEIAFFGGSFTGIERNLMIALLSAAAEYVEKYNLAGIRLSTRPDYIDEEILDILRRYNVTNIELGIQSLFDDVLSACKRGCTVEQCERACKLINSAGFGLTGQIMLGLPNSNRDKDITTAQRLADLGVQSARIYPAVILQDTELLNMYNHGEYTPISLDEAIFRAKEIKKIFDAHNIKILRMGLCSSDNINLNSCIGPYHPAFGELVEGELMYDKLCADIANIIAECDDTNAPLIIEARKKHISKIVGHGRKNIIRIEAKFSKNIKIVENNDINVEYNVRIG